MGARERTYVLAGAEGTLHQRREEDGDDVGDEHRQQQTAFQRVEDTVGEEDDRDDQRARVEQDVAENDERRQRDGLLRNHRTDSGNQQRSEHGRTSGKERQWNYPNTEPIPMSVKVDPWRIVVRVISNSAADEPNAIKVAPAASSFSLSRWQRISRLGTKKSRPS